jgi:adenylosuccinate synthase
MINGVTELVMTKGDVLSFLDEIKVCVEYEIGKNKTNRFPFDINEPVEPIYKTMKGWSVDISKIKDFSELPIEFIDYIKFIEDYLGVPVKYISVGPERDAIIIK